MRKLPRDLRRYGRVLTGRWTTLLVAVVLGVLGGFALTASGEETYSRSVTFYVGVLRPEPDEVELGDVDRRPSRANSYAALINTD